MHISLIFTTWCFSHEYGNHSQVCTNSSNRVIISGTLLKIFPSFQCLVFWWYVYDSVRTSTSRDCIFEVRQICTVAFFMCIIVVHFWPNCIKVKWNWGELWFLKYCYITNISKKYPTPHPFMLVCNGVRIKYLPTLDFLIRKNSSKIWSLSFEFMCGFITKTIP